MNVDADGRKIRRMQAELATMFFASAMHVASGCMASAACSRWHLPCTGGLITAVLVNPLFWTPFFAASIPAFSFTCPGPRLHCWKSEVRGHSARVLFAQGLTCRQQAKVLHGNSEEQMERRGPV